MPLSPDSDAGTTDDGDRATYDDPMAFPTGIEYVLVNGVVTIDHDKHTGAKAGKVLYGPGKQ